MTFLSTYRALLARLVAGIAIVTAPVYAQEAPKPADKPLELPQIVIEGTEKISTVSSYRSLNIWLINT